MASKQDRMDNGVSVYTKVPGLRSDQVEIELENDVLAVRGERPYPYGVGRSGQGERGRSEQQGSSS